MGDVYGVMKGSHGGYRAVKIVKVTAKRVQVLQSGYGAPREFVGRPWHYDLDAILSRHLGLDAALACADAANEIEEQFASRIAVAKKVVSDIQDEMNRKANDAARGGQR